jgi:hypothetical protein
MKIVLACYESAMKRMNPLLLEILTMKHPLAAIVVSNIDQTGTSTQLDRTHHGTASRLGADDLFWRGSWVNAFIYFFAV